MSSPIDISYKASCSQLLAGIASETGTKQELERYMTQYQLYQDSAKIPTGLSLFRIASLTRVLIVRSDLREKLEVAEITGIRYINFGERIGS